MKALVKVEKTTTTSLLVISIVDEDFANCLIGGNLNSNI